MKIENTFNHRELWGAFSSAVGVELRDHTSIKGASGLEHSVLGISVDDNTNRVLLFSAEPNARNAALLRIDVQATMPDVHVLVVRPIAFDLVSMAHSLSNSFGKEINATKFLSDLNEERFNDSKELEPLFETILKPSINAFRNGNLPPVDQLVSILMQGTSFNWKKLLSVLKKASKEDAFINIKDILPADSMEDDRALGVCPMPLFELNDDEWSIFTDKADKEQVVEKLKHLDVYQYFYPAADQLALGLIDRNIVSSDNVSALLNKTQEIGHSLGQNEILEKDVQFEDVVSTLEHKGMIVEGEMEYELTENGKKVRRLIKFRPREGLVSKVLNVIKPSITFKL